MGHPVDTVCIRDGQYSNTVVNVIGGVVIVTSMASLRFRHPCFGRHGSSNASTTTGARSSGTCS